jgi:hypothetical protein
VAKGLIATPNWTGNVYAKHAPDAAPIADLRVIDAARNHRTQLSAPLARMDLFHTHTPQ